MQPILLLRQMLLSNGLQKPANIYRVATLPARLGALSWLAEPQSSPRLLPWPGSAPY